MFKQQQEQGKIQYSECSETLKSSFCCRQLHHGGWARRMRILKNIGGVRGSESIARLVVSCYSYFICVNVLFCANVKILVFVVSYSGDFMYNQVWKAIPMIYRSSKCGPWTSSISTAQEPVRSANSQLPPRRTLLKLPVGPHATVF